MKILGLQSRSETLLQYKDSEEYDELLYTITNVRLRLAALEKGVEIK